VDQRTVTDLQLPKTSRQAVKCHGICPTPSFVFYHMCTTTSSKTSWNLHDSRVQSVWNCAALLTSLCITLAMLWSTVMIALQSIDTIPNPSHFSQVYVNTMPRRFRQSEPYLTQSYHPTGMACASDSERPRRRRCCEMLLCLVIIIIIALTVCCQWEPCCCCCCCYGLALSGAHSCS